MGTVDIIRPRSPRKGERRLRVIARRRRRGESVEKQNLEYKRSVMKRSILILVIVSLLTGCSALPGSIPFLQSPAPAATNPPEDTVTPFGLSASNTPDLFVINTAQATTTPPTGTPLITNTPSPTFTATTRPTITLEPIDPSLFTPSPNIFVSVQRNTNQLVWGSTCDGARSIRFIAQVAASKRLKFVLLFIRLQDKYSGRGTPWGAGAILNDNDRGVYFYTINLDQIADYRNFEDAWLQYQFVAATSTRKVLGRSVVSRNEVSLTHCKVLNP